MPAVVESPSAMMRMVEVIFLGARLGLGSGSRHYFVNSIGDAARSFCSFADTFSTWRITRRMLRPRIFLTSSSL